MKRQVENLRAKMREKKIDAYIIPTTDFHGSEYVNDYFKCREFVSGFTGRNACCDSRCGGIMDRRKIFSSGRE